MKGKLFLVFLAIFLMRSTGPLAAQSTNILYKNTIEIEPLFEILQLYHIKYLRAISNHFELGIGYLQEYKVKHEEWTSSASTILLEADYFLEEIGKGWMIGSNFWTGPAKVSHDDYPDVKKSGLLWAIQFYGGYGWRFLDEHFRVNPFLGVAIWSINVKIDDEEYPVVVFPAMGVNLGYSF